MKFLIVDDSPTIRLTLKAAVKSVAGASAQIFEAGDTARAVSEFRVGRPDVVFLDMMLASNQKGLDVLNLILQENPAAKVVLCTGLPESHPDVVDAISQGAFQYLQKPVRADAVRRVLALIDEEAGRTGRIR